MNVRLLPEIDLLKNCSANFDETWHAGQAYMPLGFKIGGKSGYSLIGPQQLPQCHKAMCPFVRMSIF